MVRSTPVRFIIVAAALAVIFPAFVLLRRSVPASATSNTPLTDEQKAYLPQIALTDAQMSAAENFLRDTVIYLDARVTNRGGKVVRQIWLELNFVDMFNQVVLRATARPINDRTPPLRPGETRAFRVSFEHVPGEWNQAPPLMTTKDIQFEER